MLAGSAIPAGGLLAKIESIHPQWLENEFRHFVMAFGGGALLSAVALVLVPEGVEYLSVGAVAFYFLAGSLAMMGLDIYLERSRMKISNLVAMMSDFLPEAIALGATFSKGHSGGAILLACLIAMQNLPEGFNAYREMLDKGNISARRILSSFALLAFLGPLCAGLGFWFLQDSDVIVAALSVFAAGGILYIVFGDIAPQAKLERCWAPPMGAILGFLLGVVGQMLLI